MAEDVGTSQWPRAQPRSPTWVATARTPQTWPLLEGRASQSMQQTSRCHHETTNTATTEPAVPASPARAPASPPGNLDPCIGCDGGGMQFTFLTLPGTWGPSTQRLAGGLATAPYSSSPSICRLFFSCCTGEMLTDRTGRGTAQPKCDWSQLPHARHTAAQGGSAQGCDYSCAQ